MRTVQEYFCEYESHHCNKHNKITHYVGIPLILVGLMGLLARIPYSFEAYAGYRIDFAIIITAMVYFLFYIRMHFLLSIFMLMCFAGFYIAAQYLSMYVLWSVFIVGWILQLVGHAVFEKEKPSFTDNLVHLLIGPLWILNHVVKCVK
ncbi:DUF962 domain-containing protein [Candidatus Uabimicrobium sp. HlEnr_7]|uniref:Mpo1 family 2-hydroxy fatty acid dioxygenase n=1 Tax=Candidatus Uabimicrobium helgolandensis TaxID=3095367 RepID=UPI003556BDF6